MEQRLAELKATMGKEREKRDAARKGNPSGAIWNSARSDLPINSSAYAEKVLEKGRQPTPPNGKPGGRRPMDAARETRPLLEAGELHSKPLASVAPGTFAQANLLGRQGGGLGASRFNGGDGHGELNATKPSFEWNPGAAQASDHDFEDLLGPVDPEPAPLPKPKPKPAYEWGHADAAARGASLLHGSFDEDESAASFQDALRAFRGEAKAERTSAAAASSTAAPPQRPSRFAVQPAGGQKPPEPTLADKVHALKEELGLGAELSMVDAVKAANGAVGFDSIGSLTEQVGRLLRETGITPKRGSAPGAAAAPSGKASFGTSTVDVSESAARSPGGSAGSRPTSSHGAMTTQTQPTKSFYDRYQEQKKREGDIQLPAGMVLK